MMNMRLLYLYLSLVLCISGTDGDKHHLIKGNETWFLSKTGNDTTQCGRTEFDACRTVAKLLKNYFDQESDMGNIHIISDASFLLNSKIQDLHPRIARLNVTVSVYNHSSDVEVILDDLNLSGSIWQFTGVSVTITNCHFLTSRFTIAPEKATSHSEISAVVDSSWIGFIKFEETLEAELNNCVIDGKERSNNTALEFHKTIARMYDTTLNGHLLQTPVIVIRDYSKVTIERSNFKDNQVTNGTIYIDDHSVLIVKQCYFSRNHASQNGGCLMLRNFSHLYILNTTFLNNTAQNTGGAIMSEHNTYIEIGNESTFDTNSVLGYNSFGGAIANFDNVTIVGISSVFKNNYADYQGGVISAENNITIILTDTKFLENTALDSSGAIRCYYDCVMKVSSSTLKSNVANDGGGIESVNATLEFSGCTFENNTSLITDTGALTAVSNSTVKIRNCVFHKNTAGRYGPAMQFYTSVYVDIEDSNFTNNFAHYGAGVIYVENYITLCIKGSYFVNNTGNRGGGAMIGGLTTTLIVTDSYFINNTAITGAGGAIDYFGNITLINTHFINNTAGYRGGAIGKTPNENQTYVQMEDCSFLDNFAELDGGAIFCLGCKLKLTRSEFIRNRVKNNGGALLVTTKSRLEIENGTFIGNFVTYGNGGAVMISDQSSIDMKGGYFNDNSAVYGGGALYTYASMDRVVPSKLQDVRFRNNHVHFMGAAMYLGPFVKITVSKCWFIQNNADTYGGVAKMDSSSESCFEECLFMNNTAKLEGGALYVKQQQNSRKYPLTKLRFADCFFLDNQSKKGTAVYIFSDIKIPSPELKTLNTIFSSAAFFNLNTSDTNFTKLATELNVIISEPDPILDITETPFASVTPEICRDCNCYYDQSLGANVYECSNKEYTDLPDSVENGTNWLVLKHSNVRSLCTYKAYLNNIVGLDIRYNKLKTICRDFLENLYQHKKIRTLQLQHNDISQLPKIIKDYTFEMLFIGNNPYSCTCGTTWMHDWLIDLAPPEGKNYVKDYTKAICTTGNKKVRGLPVYMADGGKMDCDISWYEIAIPVAVTIFTVTSTLLLFNRYVDALRFQLFLKFDILTGKDDDEEKLDDYDFDLFVSHSHLDNWWFIRNILPYLENEHHYDICIPERDWDPSAAISDCITTAIDSSRRMMIILSRNYIQSGWCMEEFLMAHARLKEGRRKLLIPIMMEDITSEDLDPTLKLYIKAYHYIKVPNNPEILRKKIIYAMPRKPLCELLAAETPADLQVQIDEDQADADTNQPGPSNQGFTRLNIHGWTSEKFISRMNKKGLPGDKMRARMIQRYKIRQDNIRKGKAERQAAIAAATEQQYSSECDSDTHEDYHDSSDEVDYTSDDQSDIYENSSNTGRGSDVSVHVPSERTPLLMNNAKV